MKKKIKTFLTICIKLTLWKLSTFKNGPPNWDNNKTKSQKIIQNLIINPILCILINTSTLTDIMIIIKNHICCPPFQAYLHHQNNITKLFTQNLKSSLLMTDLKKNVKKFSQQNFCSQTILTILKSFLKREVNFQRNSSDK